MEQFILQQATSQLHGRTR